MGRYSGVVDVFGELISRLFIFTFFARETELLDRVTVKGGFITGD